jgi:hypothetical protein
METPEPFAPDAPQRPAKPAVPSDPPPPVISGGEDWPSSGPSAARRWASVPHRLDFLLAGSVLLLAFLAASFIAVNSDFWLHLATGKLLAKGRFLFGTHPFLYINGPEYWVHHAWLFDLLLFELFGPIGGAGLVVLKAVLITALAGLLLSVRRPDGNGWLPALCTALAVVAMSPGLLLQPACLSLFFLGLTFWLLWRPHAGGGPASRRVYPGGLPHGIRLACLLLLLVLWVNLDSWFWLGPLLIGLFWMGERLDRRSARPTPTWLLPAAFAACLLNPDHLHVWWPPTELSLFWSAASLRQDVRFAGPFVSPWQGALQSLLKVQLASWAYFVLVGLGLLSFLLNWRNLSGWRLLVWGSFGLLGAWQTRAVPFFAVVAAPITALNLQDYLSRRTVSAEPSGKQRVAAVLGRLGLLGGSLVLVALAWPGWLQGFDSDARHVGWGVRADPSLQAVAETIGRWRRQGRLGDGDRAFAFHPDIAHYCAWCCPEEKSFFVQHPPLSPRVVQEYVELCRTLNPTLASGGLTPSSLPATLSFYEQETD